MSNRLSSARRKRKRILHRIKLVTLLALTVLATILIPVLIFRACSAGTESGSSGSASSSGSSGSSTSLPAESSEDAASSESSEGDAESSAPQYGLVARSESDLSRGDLILVNWENSYMEVPEGLVTIASAKTGDYLVKNNEIQLRDYVIPYLNEMMADFRTATGISNVVILSSYRSVDYQKNLYEQDLARTGRDYSDSVTKPGYSEHHTGLTFDLAYIAADGSWPFYDGHGDYGWINENSWKYGFIIRYPDDKQDVTQIIPEPWHFRYVGQAHAEMIHSTGLCLEEYMEMLRQHPVSDPYTFSGESGSWSVYYVPLTGSSAEVPVPQNKPYTVSGSNEGGFIVTVDEAESEG